MATENCSLDIRKDGNYDITTQRDRTLNQQFQAQFYSGDTLYNFDFSTYTGASLSVRTKPDYPNIILNFDTDDGSIVLSGGGLFTLVKSATEMTLRSGDYVYDMYLRGNSDFPKREFLRGNFKITNNVTQ